MWGRNQRRRRRLLRECFVPSLATGILGLGCDGALLRGMEKRKESERDRLNEVAAASTIQNQIFRPSSLLEGFPDYDYDSYSFNAKVYYYYSMSNHLPSQ